MKLAERNARMMAAALVCSLIVTGVFLAMSAAGALAAGGDTPTPQNNSSITPTPTVAPTPVPTPSPRQVLSDPRWDVDHVSILVTNNGAPITVEAYIDTPSNKNIVPVDSGVTKRVSTLPVLVENGRIVNYGFKAYENGSIIQSFENSLVIAATPTPVPETAMVSGTVVDAANGNPINGAEVIFVSKNFNKQYPSAFTDGSGVFTTPVRMFPDTYYITVKASGYKTLTGLEVPVGTGQQRISQ